MVTTIRDEVYTRLHNRVKQNEDLREKCTLGQITQREMLEKCEKNLAVISELQELFEFIYQLQKGEKR